MSRTHPSFPPDLPPSLPSCQLPVLLVLLSLCSVAVPLRAAVADVVKMKDGTVHEGKVLDQDKQAVVIETTFDGKKTLSRPLILYVDTDTPSLREQLQYRANEAKDAQARWSLYKWAKKMGFKKELSYILLAIVDVKPGDRRARKLLGHTKVDGKWLTAAEVQAHEAVLFEAEQLAKGLVPYEGKWVTPRDKEAMEQGLRKDGDDWVTEEEWHTRRGEALIGGKWTRVGLREGKELAAKAARESRVQLAYTWGPHFDVVSEVKPAVAKRILDVCEKVYVVMRRTLKPTGDEYPENIDERIKLALCHKLPGYSRFSKWFDKTYDIESMTPGWARAVQRQHGWWQVQDHRWVSVYQFPNTDKTFASNVAHNVGLVLLTRYKANYAFPSNWLQEGFAYYLEMEAHGYTQSFTIGRGGGSGGAAAGTEGPAWADSKKWRPALQKLVGDGIDPPLRRIAKMSLDMFGYTDLVKSWSVVEYLVRLDQAKFKRFVDLSKDRTKKEAEALKEAYGLTYRQLDKKWRAYVSAGFQL